jgi:hypothetical protein
MARTKLQSEYQLALFSTFPDEIVAIVSIAGWHEDEYRVDLLKKLSNGFLRTNVEWMHSPTLV